MDGYLAEFGDGGPYLSQLDMPSGTAEAVLEVLPPSPRLANSHSKKPGVACVLPPHALHNEYDNCLGNIASWKKVIVRRPFTESAETVAGCLIYFATALSSTRFESGTSLEDPRTLTQT